jgi:uncharacterized protein YggE
MTPTKKPGILLGLGVTVIAVAAIACSGEKPTTATATQPTQGTVVAGTVATQPAQGQPATGLEPATGVPVPIGQVVPGGIATTGGFYGGSGSTAASGYEAYPATIPGIQVRSPSYGYVGQEAQSPSGLWVTGIGEIKVRPDVAILSVGVEARAKTVAEAREQAAKAMQAVVDAARANGVAAADITNQYYNIYPEYRYVEVRNPDGSYGKQELVGYVVNNTAQIKVRNLENAGAVIDATAIAGGDAVRVNNIQFTVENTAQYAAQMRDLAAKDALAKANVYAQALSLKVGGVMYLAELSSQAPVIQKDLAVARAAIAEGATTPTPISADTMTLTTSIQVAFAVAQ